MRYKVLLVCFVMSAALLAAFPAAANNVDVDFGISAISYSPSNVACRVTVLAESNGVAVLEAAKQKGCIASYRIYNHPQYGNFLQCINEICGDETTGFFLTYWIMYENGCAPQTYGLDGYTASGGDRLDFTYESWTTFGTPLQGPAC